MRDLTPEESAVVAALADARSVVVCAHVDPDGDAVGSVLAATLALRSIGREATATLADDRGAPATYSCLPGFDLFRPAVELTPPEAFLALDAPTFGRLGVAEPLAHSAKRLLVVDHHPDNARFGDINAVDDSAASTASILWRLLPALGVVPDSDMASNLFAAVMTDTGRFSYSNATAETLRDAAAMIEAGADPADLYRRIYESRSAASLALLGRTLSRIKLANGGRIAYAWMTPGDLEETGAMPEETENLIDAVRQTVGVDAVAFFKLGADGVKVSLRSKCPTLDVSRVAHAFGGGGHTAAAGATIHLPLDEAIAAVLALLPGVK